MLPLNSSSGTNSIPFILWNSARELSAAFGVAAMVLYRPHVAFI
jgi:hypothetical protein